MKKVLPVLAALFILGLIGGCGDDSPDELDITFGITYNHTFTIQGDAATLSLDINLEDNDDYDRYKSKIRSVKIDYVRYSITSNTGGGGTVDLYAGNYGSEFLNAKKVAQTISFAAGETRDVTDVEWIDKAFLESLLAGGKLSLWAVGSGVDIDMIVPVVIRIEVTANPLE
ncbi:MAG: hypothetical protein R6V76_00415 [Desulfobacterales bacterium]